jgi:Cysteine-rich CPCC
MTRDEAVRLIAKEAMNLLPIEKRRTIIEEWWGHGVDIPDLDYDLRQEVKSEEGPSEISDQRYDPLVLHALQAQWMGVSNAYLSEKLRGLGYEDEIVGSDPELLVCPCCSYKTLMRRGHYDICPVCFWEDDGGNDPSRYSSPNHMTLEEARRNFVLFGACSPEHVPNVDPEGTRKYHL